jgi:6-phosphogluconolactonase
MSRRVGGAAATRGPRPVLTDVERSAELRVCRDAEELAAAAAVEIARRARGAVTSRGLFTLALSGGSTPTRLYAVLARQQAGRGAVPWGKVHVFWGDERAVPPGHPESNFRAANEALLSRVPIPEGNVHRIRAELGSAAAAAELYETELRDFFRTPVGRFPRFDLVLLGLGADGHTASLFPESGALGELTRLVVAPLVPRLGAHRITLTLPVLNGAREVMFLVSGEGKAGVLAQVLEGGTEGVPLPARLVRPRDGALLWFVDRAAAKELRSAPAKSRRRSGPARPR